MNISWKYVFYISTVLFSLGILMGAYFDFTQAPPAVDVLAHLGYPAYLAVIIGAAKFLGVVGIWQNQVQFLREWAYAGFFIDLIGALISHITVGDGFTLYAPAMLHIVVLTISYVAFRKLGYGCNQGPSAKA